MRSTPAQRDRWRHRAGDQRASRSRRPIAGPWSASPARRSGSASGPRAGPRRRGALGDPTGGRRAGGSSSRPTPPASCGPGGIDVGRAGTILVVGCAHRRGGAHAGPGDGRPRASSWRRSPARSGATSWPPSRASARLLHRLPPFAVLVLEGAIRRPIAGADRRALRGARRPRGRDRRSTRRPLVFDEPDVELPRSPPDLVRVRVGRARRPRGPLGGPGRAASLRGAAFLEAGWVRLDDGGRRSRSRWRISSGSSDDRPDARPAERRAGGRYPRPVPAAPQRTRRRRPTTPPRPARSPPGSRAVARPGDLSASSGELGAGKTQFAKGFARGPRRDRHLNSPTFVLMSEYDGRLPLFHVDLYRLADAADALAGGLLDERQRDGRHARRVARAAGPAAAGVRGSTSASTGPATSRARSRSRPATRASRGTSRRRSPRTAAEPATARATVGGPRSSRSTRRRARPWSRSGAPDGDARWARRRGRPATATASSSCRAIGRLLGEANLRRSRIARRRRRDRARARSPGCASGSRPPRPLAHALGVPIVGVSTGEALLAAAAAAATAARRAWSLLLPAGPNDRRAASGRRAAVLLPGGTEPELGDGERLVAVDLAGRAPADALGPRRARRGRASPAAPAPLGAARLARPAATTSPASCPSTSRLPRGVEPPADERGGRDGRATPG